MSRGDGADLNKVWILYVSFVLFLNVGMVSYAIYELSVLGDTYGYFALVVGICLIAILACFFELKRLRNGKKFSKADAENAND